MSNAVKFTFSGSIIVSMRIEIRENMKVLVITVKDTGLGIKDKDKSKLFHLFGMISETKSINLNGSGIGLTICRKYVERLGGEISLESKFGEGTSVTFWVPVIAPQESPTRKKSCKMQSMKEPVGAHGDEIGQLIMHKVSTY